MRDQPEFLNTDDDPTYAPEDAYGWVRHVLAIVFCAGLTLLIAGGVELIARWME